MSGKVDRSSAQLVFVNLDPRSECALHRRGPQSVAKAMGSLLLQSRISGLAN
jgi:hypothetical protein